MSIFCTVEDSYCTGLEANGLQLLRVRLKICLVNKEVIGALSYAFVPKQWRQLKGLPVRVQFANCDLSQVIIQI